MQLAQTVMHTRDLFPKNIHETLQKKASPRKIRRRRRGEEGHVREIPRRRPPHPPPARVRARARSAASPARTSRDAGVDARGPPRHPPPPLRAQHQHPRRGRSTGGTSRIKATSEGLNIKSPLIHIYLFINTKYRSEEEGIEPQKKEDGKEPQIKDRPKKTQSQGEGKTNPLTTKARATSKSLLAREATHPSKEVCRANQEANKRPNKANKETRSKEDREATRATYRAPANRNPSKAKQDRWQ